MKKLVRWTAEFETVIDVEEGENESDATTDITIPEDNVSRYVTDTFDVEEVTDLPNWAAVYQDGLCPDCGRKIPDRTQDGECCENCEHVFWVDPTLD